MQALLWWKKFWQENQKLCFLQLLNGQEGCTLLVGVTYTLGLEEGAGNSASLFFFHSESVLWDSKKHAGILWLEILHASKTAVVCACRSVSVLGEEQPCLETLRWVLVGKLLLSFHPEQCLAPRRWELGLLSEGMLPSQGLLLQLGGMLLALRWGNAWVFSPSVCWNMLFYFSVSSKTG